MLLKFWNYKNLMYHHSLITYFRHTVLSKISNAKSQFRHITITQLFVGIFMPYINILLKWVLSQNSIPNYFNLSICVPLNLKIYIYNVNALNLYKKLQSLCRGGSAVGYSRFSIRIQAATDLSHWNRYLQLHC